MRVALIVLAALLLAATSLAGLGYGAFKFLPRIVAELTPDSPIDAATLVENVEAQLKVAKSPYDRWVALGAC
jgi:hypothetical protein